MRLLQLLVTSMTKEMEMDKTENNREISLEEILSTPGLSEYQKELLTDAYNDGVKPEYLLLYNKPEFSPRKISIITFGFIRGINATLYCNPKMKLYLMYDVYHGLIYKKDVSWLVEDFKYDGLVSDEEFFSDIDQKPMYKKEGSRWSLIRDAI